jgi:hypothetical protein
LDEALLVDRRGDIFEIDGGSYRLSKLADKAHVDVGFEKGRAYLFEHRVEGLGESARVEDVWERRVSPLDLFVDILLASEVVNGRIDAPSKILKHHDVSCVRGCGDVAQRRCGVGDVRRQQRPAEEVR